MHYWIPLVLAVWVTPGSHFSHITILHFYFTLLDFSKILKNAISECSGRFRDPKHGPSGFGEKKLIIYALLPRQIVVSLNQKLSSLATNDIVSRGRDVVWVVGINESQITVTKISVLHSRRAAHGDTYLTFSPWNGRWNTSIQEFGNNSVGHYRFCATRKIQYSGKKCYMFQIDEE